MICLLKTSKIYTCIYKYISYISHHDIDIKFAVCLEKCSAKNLKRFFKNITRDLWIIKYNNFTFSLKKNTKLSPCRGVIVYRGAFKNRIAL